MADGEPSAAAEPGRDALDAPSIGAARTSGCSRRCAWRSRARSGAGAGPGRQRSKSWPLELASVPARRREQEGQRDPVAAVARVGPAPPVEQDAGQPRPDPVERLCRPPLPVPRASPAGHARPTPPLPGQARPSTVSRWSIRSTRRVRPVGHEGPMAMHCTNTMPSRAPCSSARGRPTSAADDAPAQAARATATARRKPEGLHPAALTLSRFFNRLFGTGIRSGRARLRDEHVVEAGSLRARPTLKVRRHAFEQNAADAEALWVRHGWHGSPRSGYPHLRPWCAELPM